MCGLVGCVGELTDADIVAFSYLGSLASLRGVDSTGFMDWRDKGKNREQPGWTYGKSLEDAHSVFATNGKFYFDFVWKSYVKHNPTVLAAHARAATIGKITVQNAHPFRIEHVLGMHNGTIRFGLDNADKFETDSQALFDNLVREGDVAIQKLVDNSNAAYALVWIDSRDKTLNLMRNAERPLYLLKSYSTQICFWASDKSWLEAVLPYFKYPCAQIVPASVNMKYSFNLKNPKKAVSEVKETLYTKTFHFRGYSTSERDWVRDSKEWTEANWINQPDAKETNSVAEKSNNVVRLPLNHGGQVSGADGVQRYWYEKYKMYLTYEEFQEKEKKNASAIIPFQEDGTSALRKTFGELYVTNEVYDKILHNGCCGCPKIAEKYELIEFIDRDAYLCPTCKEDEHWRSVVIKDYIDAKLIGENIGKTEGDEVTCH